MGMCVRKGGEARVHLVGNRAGHGARIAVLRPEPRVREQLVDVFQDRQGLPDGALAVQQHGNAPRRRHSADGFLPVLAKQQKQPFTERDSGVAQRKPGPKRPGRVVLVADHQRQLAHGDTHTPCRLRFRVSDRTKGRRNRWQAGPTAGPCSLSRGVDGVNVAACGVGQNGEIGGQQRRTALAGGGDYEAIGGIGTKRPRQPRAVGRNCGLDG